MHKNMILQNLPLLLIALSPRHRAAMAFTSPHISVCYLAEQGILTRRFGQLTVGCHVRPYLILNTTFYPDVIQGFCL